MDLERTTKQLKEAIAIAGEETAKCKAAKEVIKSLTAQVKFFLSIEYLLVNKNRPCPVLQKIKDISLQLRHGWLDYGSDL